MANSDEIKRLTAELKRLRLEFGETENYKIVSTNEVNIIKELNSQILEYRNSLDEIADSWGTVKGIIDDVQKQFGKSADGFKTALSSFNRLQSISNKFREDALGLQKMSSKEIKSNITNIQKEIVVQQEALNLLIAKSKTAEGLTENEKNMVEELQSENIQNKLALKTARARLTQEQKIQKTLGITGTVVQGLEGTFKKIGMNADFFEDLNEDMYEAAKSGSKLKVALTGLKGIGKGIAGQLNDPVVIFGSIFKGLKALYQLTGKFIKQQKEAFLATSGAFGKGAIKNMESTQGLFENLTASANALRTELGFVPDVNKQILTGVHTLVDGFGMSGAEAANLFKLSEELGISVADMPGHIAGLGGEMEAASGMAIDFQEAMGIVANASASTRFNMKGSANQLIRAANFASLLNMSMSDIQNAAESTLDFESSIQKEMEAELFLNKNLNLEKYRYAALTGDATTQASELQRLIKENGPSLKGNVLAQQKFADALGISKEQLAESIESMELQEKLGFKAVGTQKALDILMKQGLTKEQAMSKLRQQGADGVTNAIEAEKAFQNRFELAQRKFQEAFTGLAEKIFSPSNMAKIDKMISAFADFMGGPVMQGVINYLPHIAAALAALSVLKMFNPIQNVGIMNVARMNGGMGGGGMGGGGGGYGSSGSGGKRGKKGKGSRGRGSRGRGRRGGRRGGRGRGLGGLAIGLGSMLAMDMALSSADNAIAGDEGGDGGASTSAMGTGMLMNTGIAGAEVGADVIGNNIANKGAKATSSGGGFLSKQMAKLKGAGGGMLNLGAKAKDWVGSKIGGIFPKILGTIKKPLRGVLSKIPLVGAIIEAIFTGMDVNAIAKSQDLSKEEMYADMGASVISGGLGLTMGSLAAAAVSSLQAVGIPGWLLSGAAFMGGDWLGRLLGNAISDHIGGPLLGKSIFDLFYKDAPKEMATGGIVTGPTNAIVGEAGAEAVVPLNEFYAKIDELIQVVKDGGDVYLDGAKVGKSLVMATSKIG